MTSAPRLLLIGPGAMGCLHAALLAEAGLPVTLLDHRPERAARLAAEGLRLTWPDGREQVTRLPCTADPASLPPADLALLFVKAYDTAAAVDFALPALGRATTLLTLQNGLGNYEILQQRLLPAQVLAGTTSSGATLLGEGRLRVAGLGEILLGSPSGDHARAARAAAALRHPPLQVRLTRDVDSALWRKAILNAAINPLGALTRRRNGELLEVPSLRDLLGEVAREATAVALEYVLGMGSELAGFDPAAAVEQVCLQTAANQCSMLQDVLAGRRTEIRQINGEIVRRAEQVELPAPLSRALLALVEGLAAKECATADGGTDGTAERC